MKVVEQKHCEYCNSILNYNPWFSFFVENSEVIQKPVCDDCISRCSYILKNKENKLDCYQQRGIRV